MRDTNSAVLLCSGLHNTNALSKVYRDKVNDDLILKMCAYDVFLKKGLLQGKHESNSVS